MSGLANGASKHGPECQCPRCIGFQPGNALALTHGSYSAVQLTPRARELAETVRSVAPVVSQADEFIIASFGLILARIERASEALEGAEPDELLRLNADLRAWTGMALKYADSLGLTPGSRARLGLDLVRTEKERLTVTRLAALAREEEAA